MTAERGGQGEARPRFPALDPEPPPAARYRRVMLGTGVTVVLLVAVLGLARLTSYLLSHRGHAHAVATHPSASVRTRTASAAPVATIVSFTPNQYLAVSDLRETRPTILSSLGQMISLPSETVDNRYLVTPDADVISFTGQGHPLIVPMKDVNPDNWSTVGSEPLADHDRYAVLDFNAGTPGQGNSPVEISSLATGTAYTPWQVDDAAGDPQAIGVFASVAAPLQPTSHPTNTFPDASVKLLDVGRPPVLLATAAQLNGDVRLGAGTPTSFFPYPSPSGALVAVAVQPDVQEGVSALAGGLVVLTRTGHVVASFPGAGAPAWSPSGTSLAFASGSKDGSVLHIWTTPGHLSSQAFPASAGNPYSDCIWSPSGAWILCAAYGPHDNGQDWAVASAAGGPMVVTRGPGLPITWLGAAQ